MAKCGNCGKAGVSVAEIRNCYATSFGRDMGELTSSNVAVTEDTVRVTPVEITEGIWMLDETVYKVQTSRGYGGTYSGPGTRGYSGDTGGAGKLYGKRLVLLDEPYEKTVRGKVVTVKAEWEYEGGVPGKLKRGGARQLNTEEAARYGQLSGKCMFCGLDLTDERSMHVGYGPDCAEREGLPWGERPTIELTSEGSL